MPIERIEEKLKFPLRGKIGLGTEREIDGGRKVPKNEDFFVISHLPEVVEVYGNNPKELHIQFAYKTRLESAPSWLKWYGASRTDAQGNKLGGPLMCYGDGSFPIERAAAVTEG